MEKVNALGDPLFGLEGRPQTVVGHQVDDDPDQGGEEVPVGVLDGEEVGGALKESVVEQTVADFTPAAEIADDAGSLGGHRLI